MAENKNYPNEELHAHSTGSINDGTQLVPDMVITAASKGATALAITDHGNCINWLPFYNMCKGAEVDHRSLKAEGFDPIKPILGTESYIAKEEDLYEGFCESEDDDEESDPDDKEVKVIRQHLILLAMDYKGMQAIARFVTETNRHIDAKGKPVGTVGMLKTFFGPDSLGYGHVVCQSACIAGVIANPLMFNIRIDREIAKVQRRIDKSRSALPNSIAVAITKVAEANAKIEKIDAKVAELEAEIEELKPLAKKSFADIKKTIKAEKNEAKKAYLQQELDIEIANTKKAKDDTKALREHLKDLKTTKTAYKTSTSDERKLITKNKPKLATIETNEAKIEFLNSRRKSEEEIMSDAAVVVDLYKEIFGENFYGEVQYHGIPEEAYVMPLIAKVSHAKGIKLVATNDVHMCRKEDALLRDLMRNVGYIKQKTWHEPITGDSELYFKTGEEKAEMLSQILSEEDVDEAMYTIREIVDKCNVELSNEKHYPDFKDSIKCLRELAETGHTKAEFVDGSDFIEIDLKTAGIEARYGKNWNEELQNRMDYELSVIEKMNFGSYFIAIADVIAQCKAHFVGIPIGPGRGSGAGSIVCYLSGITELEPISLNLLFERFLSPTRVSMPDIDTDFSKEARAYAVSYVQSKYGAKAVAGIMTKAKMGPKNALTYAPKLLAMSRKLDPKTYQMEGIKLRAICGDAGHLSEIKDEVESEFAEDENALTIYRWACMMEGQITSTGQHAAGNIVIQSDAVENYIPLMLAADEEGGEAKMVIQADMVEAEAQLGFIKYDYLGLKELNILTRAFMLIKEHYGKELNFYGITPDDPAIYKDIYAAGNTNFVFQFESKGMVSMLRQLNPTCFGDLILAVSVYRPGPMDFIPDIIRCKDTGAASPIVERIPMLADILSETYGFPVYQEQVMQIMTKAGGFDMGHADDVRRFMSKKKEDKLAAERPKFVEGCVGNGIKEEDANWLFDQLMPFAKYGFNKSHAAAYSLVSYFTAYCKYYYPEEYLCAAMTERGAKTLQFMAECKRFGIEVLPVDINASGVDFTVEGKGKVRIGLSAIKGVTNDAKLIVEAREEGVFASIQDFVKRAHLKSNVVKAVILAGACDNYSDNRESATKYAAEYAEKDAEVVSATAKVAEYTDKFNSALKLGDEKAAKNKEKTLNDWKVKLLAAKTALKGVRMQASHSLSTEARLAYESFYLGMWVTGSPLEDYDTENPKYNSVEDLQLGDHIKTIGVITGLENRKTRNGDRMVTFTVLDKDSEDVKCVIYPRDLEKIDLELKDNMVIELDGEISEWDDEPQIIISRVRGMKASEKSLLITCKLLQYADEVEPLVAKYMIYAGGLELRVVIGGRVRECVSHVSSDIIPEMEKLGIQYSVA